MINRTNSLAFALLLAGLWLAFAPVLLQGSSANYATNRANRERGYSSNMVQAYGNSQFEAYNNAKKKIPQGSNEKSNTISKSGNQYLCVIVYITPRNN